MASPSRRFATTFKPQVFIPSLVVIGALCTVCAWMPSEANAFFSIAQRWVIGHFDWFYVLAVTAFLIFVLLIAASDYGNIKLGPDDSEPEFGFVSWTAMLFAAGMGIGLMYFGVGEPMQHFLKPPMADAGTPAAAREAMLMTFFHWGFHAWAIYCVMGLVLAYFGFRYNLPLTLRSGLYPLLRERIDGWIGHSVDAFALVGTVAGIASTLGYGVMQLGAGLHTIAGWDTSGNAFRVGLVAIVVTLAGVSAASGLDKGVRRLSELNLLLAFLLLAFVVATGPTSFLLRALPDNVGAYLSNLVDLSFRTYAYVPPREEGWFGGWTILYWAWWISWSPFVGMFIARISRGRTIRQFIIGVLLVPTTFNLVWMTAFGNSAIWLDSHGATGALAQASSNVDALLFLFFEYLPFSRALSVVAIILVTVFFVTSADSGAFVIDQIATRGATNSPVWQRLFWAAVLGVTAALLLIAGGLGALQTMTLVAALPVAAIMLMLCYGLWRGLLADRTHSTQDMGPATTFWTGQHWRYRLTHLLRQTTREEARQFLGETVLPALEQVARELRANGVDASTQRDDEDAVRLTVHAEGQRDFVYGARVTARPAPALMIRETVERELEHSAPHAIMTFFEDGRIGYDIEYLRTDEVIADVLRHYERYGLISADARADLLTRAPRHAK